MIKHHKPTHNLLVCLNCDVGRGVGMFEFQWHDHYHTHTHVFIEAHMQKQHTTFYHLHAMLLCTQCLYEDRRSTSH